MKVENPLSFSPCKTTEKGSLKKRRGASLSFSVEMLELTDIASPFPAEARLDLCGLLSQEERRREAIKKSTEILDFLSQIQSHLLNGQMPEETLHLLKDTPDLNAQEIEDLSLRNLLEEIDMRRLVVLTQLKMAFQKNTT